MVKVIVLSYINVKLLIKIYIIKMQEIIPFDLREGVIWFDGKISPWQDCKIHILNHGLHYGSSFFEGIRVYNKKPFKMREHYERFLESAKILGIELPFSIEELEAATIEQMKLNNVDYGYIRPIAWRGCETMLISGKGAKTHLAIAVWSSFESTRVEKRQSGMKLCISDWQKPSKNTFPIHAKTAGLYTLCTIVKNDATIRGYDDAIMIDLNDNISEATTSNFFAIVGNEIITPEDDNCLKGVTRKTILQLCEENDIKIKVRKINKAEIENFDAAFLTGTAIEIMPIASIEHKKLNVSHPIIQDLMQKFDELTHK
jgi:branched-chain amino acid aminotransferase